MTHPGNRPPTLHDLPPGGPQRSERGRILPPDLDDRRWQDLVDEASALIDRYAPQWTDRSPSDIGMTVVELFAWLVESLIYRLNRVPEKNYVAFLDLLGITRAPATPARTLLTFTASGDAVTVPERTPAQTAGSELEAPVVFETDAEITVTAVRTVGAVRVDHSGDAGDARYEALAVALQGRHRARIDVDLSDLAAVQICLAMSATTAPTRLDLFVEPFRSPGDAVAGQRIEWVYSPADGTRPFGWPQLEVVQDGTAGLVRAGVVRLRVPAAGPPWGEQDPQSPDAGWSLDDPVTDDPGARYWVGLRITNDPALRPAGVRPGPLRLRLDRLLVNTAPASSVGTVLDERVGEGTGRARQVHRLARYPVYARPGTDRPYDHVEVRVGGVAWRRVEYLADGAGESYLLDPVTGELTFGDHDPASGEGSATVPSAGQEIRATYRHVAAAASANVAPDGVRLLTSGPAGLTGVTNPARALGGADEEPIEATKRRAPEVLRHRERAVTADDYELLARSAAPEVAITRCLPPRLHTRDVVGGWQTDDPWTYGNLQRAPGVVNVVVVPDLGPDEARPEPALALVQDVVRVLDRRRPVGTALHVTGPRYVPVKVVVTVAVFDSSVAQGLVESVRAVEGRVEQEIRAFLHPVRGGRDGAGWQVGESVYITEVYRQIQLPADVGYVTELGLVPQRPLYLVGNAPHQRPIPDAFESGSGGAPVPPTNQVRIADYELVCCGDLEVRAVLDT